MAVDINDRPIERVREQVIDRLIMNYSHGELHYEAFDRRLDQAINSDSAEQLHELVNDLPLNVDAQYKESKQQNMGSQFVTPEDGYEEEESVVSIFGGSDRKGAWLVPKSLNLVSVCGGNKIDFTDAKFTEKVVRIKVFKLFAGAEIYVPHDANIVSKAVCICGGLNIGKKSKKNIAAPSLAGPTIIIEGFILFSGVDIKVRHTVKEKFTEFAQFLRELGLR